MKVGIGPLSLDPNFLFLILFLVKQLPGNLASVTFMCYSNMYLVNIFIIVRNDNNKRK